MINIFIELINSGKITSLEGLKKVFRKLAKKTHPDSVGSNLLAEKFIKLKNDFEEAKRILNFKTSADKESKVDAVENFRYLFFLDLQELYMLESSFFWEKKYSQEKLILINKSVFDHFKEWKKDLIPLHVSAFKEYDIIRNEKHKNIISNLRKPSIYMNLRPVFFNLFKYHITGLLFYKKQLRNFMKVMTRLEENNFIELKKYLMTLIQDMENGPALFG
jgi:curved DNA-binding protein CbpA